MLFRFAIAVSFLTLVLLAVGGTVNPSGSSLACPDWPLCYGQFFPKMENGVQFEHSHRLAASTVGMLTFILTVMIWRRQRKLVDGDRGLFKLSLFASGLVIFQGILGGITVIFRLPMAVSVTHLAVSMFFFLLTIYLCFRVRYAPKAGAILELEDSGRGLTALATLGVYAQILLGALVRHTRSGRACETDIPLCLGQIWPSFGPGQVHMLHRIAGVIVFLLVVVASFDAQKRARALGRIWVGRLAMFAPWTALIQILIGVWTVKTWIGLWPAVFHLTMGAALLAQMTIVHIGLGPQLAEQGAR